MAMTGLEFYTIKLLGELLVITVPKTVFDKVREVVNSWCDEAKAKHLRDKDCDLWYSGNEVFAQMYCRVNEVGGVLQRHCVLTIYNKNLAEYVLQILFSDLAKYYEEQKR